MSSLIEFDSVYKIYQMGDITLEALKGVSFKIDARQLVAIMGPSGSGKSTLMNLIGLLDTPSRGHYLLEGKPIEAHSDDELAQIRNKNIGFVFQSFYLLSKLTAVQNVCLPLLYRGITFSKAKPIAMSFLERVNMHTRAQHKPHELSGGQQQRVAIARALVGNPSVILADEPTGALDTKIGQDVMDLFRELHQKEGKTIIIITHDPDIAAQCEITYHIRDGEMSAGEKNS